MGWTRQRGRRRPMALGLFLGLLPHLASCAMGSGGPAAPPAPAPERPPFAGERAFADLQALVDLGPRATGSPGAQRARELLETRLEALGFEVSSQQFSVDVASADRPAAEIENLIGILESQAGAGYLVLATHYDTDHFAHFEFTGANDGASGPALLLELARLFSEEPLPYGLILAFLDGESRLPGLDSRESLGARGFVDALRAQGMLRQVRLVVFVDQVADAELSIPRDLLSHRASREAFWRAASRLGHADAFAPDAPVRELEGGHEVLFRAGLRRVVAIEDDAYGGDAPPGIYAHSEDDTPAHCSARSLEIVGSVIAAGLRDLAGTMQRVDRFAPPPPAPAETPGEEGAIASQGAAPGDGESDASPPVDTPDGEEPAEPGPEPR